MKPVPLLTAALLFLPAALATAGPASLHVSESGANRVAVLGLDESTGELMRIGALDLPGAPGSLAVFEIDPATGELTSLGRTPTEKTPRSFCLTPGDTFAVAAGQGSDRLIVYRRDAASGTLAPLKTIDCGKSPAWILGVKLD